MGKADRQPGAPFVLSHEGGPRGKRETLMVAMAFAEGFSLVDNGFSDITDVSDPRALRRRTAWAFRPDQVASIIDDQKLKVAHFFAALAEPVGDVTRACLRVLDAAEEKGYDVTPSELVITIGKTFPALPEEWTDDEWIVANWNTQPLAARMGALPIKLRQVRNFIERAGRLKRICVEHVSPGGRRQSEHELIFPNGLKPEIETELVQLWNRGRGRKGSRYRELRDRIWREGKARFRGEKTTVFLDDD